MSVEAIRNQLVGYAGLTNLVSTRIYRGNLPQGVTYPAIMFRATVEPLNTLGGETVLTNINIVFECYADDYAEIESIVTQLKAALAAATTFEAICEAEADDQYQDDTGMYSVFLDYSIWI